MIQAWFCNCQQYLYSFHIVFEYIPGIRDQGKMLVLPNQLLCLVISTSDQCFCFFPANLMSSTYTDKNNPFDGVRISIPNWKPSPNRALIGFSQIAFHIIVLPKEDLMDSAQEEQLGLRCWTMI